MTILDGISAREGHGETGLAKRKSCLGLKEVRLSVSLLLPISGASMVYEERSLCPGTIQTYMPCFLVNKKKKRKKLIIEYGYI